MDEDCRCGTTGGDTGEPPGPLDDPQESPGIVKDLGSLPPGSIVPEEALARMFGRHPVSIKRAVERGELPPRRGSWESRSGRRGGSCNTSRRA